MLPALAGTLYHPFREWQFFEDQKANECFETPGGRGADPDLDATALSGPMRALLLFLALTVASGGRGELPGCRGARRVRGSGPLHASLGFCLRLLDRGAVGWRRSTVSAFTVAQPQDS